MTCRRSFISSAAGATVLISAKGLSLAASGSIPIVTAITRVYGDGVRLIALAVRYGVPIVGKGLTTGSFKVEGRTVVDVFPSPSADPDQRSETGPFLIIALSADDPGACLRKKSAAQTMAPTAKRDRVAVPAGRADQEKRAISLHTTRSTALPAPHLSRSGKCTWLMVAR